MRKILIASIFVLTFCIFAFGQDSNCPKIFVTGPASVPEPNETMTFSVTVNEKAKDLKLEYIWSVDKGKIIEGQGTQIITIVPDLDILTATVEIKGLPKGCENIFTESMSCTLRPAQPKIVDELLTSDSQIDNAKLDRFIDALRDSPDSTGYIIIYEDEKTPSPIPERKEKQIRDSIKEKNILPERIVIVRGGEGKDMIRLWLVPVGAEPPTP